ncbi:hypothetical protein ACIQMJ_11495 [Actinosynnema sp. NPDC091369]
MASQWLYAYGSGGTFAWTDNEKDFYLAGSGEYWAWRSGNWLYATKDKVLGWFDGKTFYDQSTGRALYYFE